MTKTVLLASAAALALTGAGSATATANHPALSGKIADSAKHVIVLPHNATILYDQSAGSNGIGIVSQNFTDFSSGNYDATGADDFVLPAGKHAITEVDANGIYFNGPGPADSFNVAFYKTTRKGASACCKGAPVMNCPNQSYTDLTGTGYAAINLSGCTPALFKKLKGGKHYYITVQANMAFGSGGEWGWNTNNNVVGSPAEWENPGGGFGTGCTTFTVLTTCIASGEGGDFAFALQGH